MSSDGKRKSRVAHLLQQEIGQLLSQDLKDPRIGFCTVTEVRPSSDLRTARVYVSIYGPAEQRQESLKRLQKAAGFLQRELGHRVRLRYTPELTFVADESLDVAERLDELMEAIEHGETETPTHSEHQPVAVETNRTALANKRGSFARPVKKPTGRVRRGKAARHRR